MSNTIDENKNWKEAKAKNFKLLRTTDKRASEKHTMLFSNNLQTYAGSWRFMTVLWTQHDLVACYDYICRKYL